MNDKNKIPTTRKEELKDQGAERAENDEIDGVSIGNELLGKEDENEIRQESFEHTKEVMRDEGTRKKVNEEQDEDD